MYSRKCQMSSLVRMAIWNQKWNNFWISFRFSTTISSYKIQIEVYYFVLRFPLNGVKYSSHNTKLHSYLWRSCKHSTIMLINVRYASIPIIFWIFILFDAKQSIMYVNLHFISMLYFILSLLHNSLEENQTKKVINKYNRHN